MDRLRDLQGLGPKSEQMLVAAGIDSVATLQSVGAIRAFVTVTHYQQDQQMLLSKEGSPVKKVKPSLNLLYALVGALEGEHWLSIAKSQKSQLIMALDDYHELEKLFSVASSSFDTI